MGLLSNEDKDYLKNLYNGIDRDVELIFFSSNEESRAEDCANIEDILKELSELSDKIKVEKHVFEEEKELADKMEVEMAPSIVVKTDKGYGIKYYGVPAGYEFSSLVEDINDIGTGIISVEDEAREMIMSIDKPVHIRVFITPTCPYCPAAVRTAHKFAMLNENIKADMVESYEFSDFSNKYDVSSVPRIVINEDHHFVGAYPDKEYAKEIFNIVK